MIQELRTKVSKFRVAQAEAWDAWTVSHQFHTLAACVCAHQCADLLIWSLMTQSSEHHAGLYGQPPGRSVHTQPFIVSPHRDRLVPLCSCLVH